MKRLDVLGPGLQEIGGGDVVGGEMIPPLGVALIVAGVGYLVANWPDFKTGFADGFYGR